MEVHEKKPFVKVEPKPKPKPFLNLRFNARQDSVVH